MTHPKRPISSTTTANSNKPGIGDKLSSSSSPLISTPSMKKARSDKDKFCAHPRPTHFNDSVISSKDRVRDEEDDDGDAMLMDHVAAHATATVNPSPNFASNLTRKKAIPPQPSVKKQLIIKLHKGFPDLFLPSQ